MLVFCQNLQIENHYNSIYYNYATKLKSNKLVQFIWKTMLQLNQVCILMYVSGLINSQCTQLTFKCQKLFQQIRRFGGTDVQFADPPFPPFPPLPTQPTLCCEYLGHLSLTGTGLIPEYVYGQLAKMVIGIPRIFHFKNIHTLSHPYASRNLKYFL